MILLDTMVLSELRKSHPNPKVMAWLQQLPTNDVFISVISIGEIERGISKAADIARRCGRLSAELGHDGADLLIAATAAAHRLTVATRNLRHSKPTGVAVLDPFA